MTLDNSNSPLISIITVCFNEAESRINHTMSTIDNQSYSRIQKIIIDGKSHPTTLKTLKKFSHGNTIMLSEPDGGIYDAMNKGIRLAQGDYLIFMNIGDSFYNNDVIKDAVQMITSAPYADVYYGNVMKIQTGYSDIEQTKYTEMPYTLTTCWLFLKTICHQSMLINRNCFSKYGSFNLKYSLLSDRDWLLRAIKNGCSCQHLPLIICNFENGGACSDWTKTRKERKVIQKEYFSIGQQLVFHCYWLAKKSADRFKTSNFRMPVALREAGYLQHKAKESGTANES